MPSKMRICTDIAASFVESCTQVHWSSVQRRTVLPLRPYTLHFAGMTLQYSVTISDVKSFSGKAKSHDDLNNTDAMRPSQRPPLDHTFAFRSLAIPPSAGGDELGQRYRPFLLSPSVTNGDWVSRLELGTVTRMAYEDMEKTGERLRVLVLYGSLRKRYVS